RVNWQPKSENIRSIAKELNLGLGSVLFLDDNPAECAEVRANCPEVLCLELPEPARVPAFLQHVWAFDLAKVTDEDAVRSRHYQDNRERAAFEAEAPTYADFIQGLNLVVDIGEVTVEQLPRLAQLTQRTNQFNFTGRIRTMGEVRALVECPEATALTVTVKDRFGNYGLVGTVIYRRCANVLQVDTFLLSCRVLGKGVEHAMLARLGLAATHHGLDTVEIPFIPTPRNLPASEFLQSVGRDFHADSADGLIYRFPADQAAAIRFDPSMRAAASAKPVSNSQAAGFANPSGKGKPASELFAWIERHASSAQAVLKAIEAEPTFAGPSCAGYVAPRTELEQRISQIWKKLLRREPIGVRDNFFQLGGDSVIAMRLFVKLENLTGKRLPLATLFEAPTIELLAKLIEDQGWEPAWQSLVAIKAGGSKPPLYCVHGVGGNIVSYMDLAKYLEPDQPLYGLQAVGLNGKRPRRNLTVEEMAAIYIQEVCAFQPRGPYLLGGTSFGGLVAYEMAQQLVKAGEEVALLALFDTYGPGYPRLLPGTTVWKARWNHLRMRFNLHWGNLMATDRRERLSYVAAKLARLKTTARRVMRTRALLLKGAFRERVNRLLRPHVIRQVSKAGHWAAGDYEPKPFNGSITLFRATEQPHGIHPDPYLGWEPLVPAIKIYNTPGHHGGIVLEPRVKILSEQLADALRHARSQALQPQNNLPRSA
ncbi:MAG: family phosphatase, partial [Bryobacterales bacterium]|nr:family phosphatase [Bryobacterales bacterium]